MALPPLPQQKAIITQAAAKYGIDPKILWGVYGTETSFGKDLSTSSAGAVGPFQFEPATAKSLGVNPNDFKSAAFGAAQYLSQFKGRGTGGMLSAYNAGPAGGIQQGYVQTVLKNAQSWHGDPSATQAPARSQASQVIRTPGTSKTTQQVVGRGALADLSGLLKTKSAFDIGPKIPGLENPSSPLEAAGLFNPGTVQNVTTKTPASTRTVQVQGQQFKPTNSSAGGNRHAGYFLPAGAKYIVGRADQGRDGQTDPGGPIIAPGDGQVIAVKSDPNGFGPAYPIVHFTSGPYAGQDVYVGHTISAIKPGGHFTQGQVLSHTGTHGIGNATVPGWFEIGYAGGGTPGPFGQKTPF